VFGHLPLIKNKDGTKLSKRQNDVHIASLRTKGYSAEAILSLVVDAGGGFENKEHHKLYMMEDLIEKFNISRITTNSCRLEMDRLESFSQMDLQRRLENTEELEFFANKLRKMLNEEYSDKIQTSKNPWSQQYLREILSWSKSRIVKLTDLLTPKYAYLWIAPKDLPLEQLPKIQPNNADVIQYLMESFVVTPPERFTNDNLSKLLKQLADRFSLKTPQIMKLLRIAVTGQKEGPPVAEMFAILGKETSIDRLKHAYSILDKR